MRKCFFFSTVGKKTLFHRMGGEAMIFKSLELFYNKVQADPVLVKYVRNIKVPKVVEHQKRIILASFGGHPGVDLAQLAAMHKKLSISDNEFNSLKSLLRETFEQLSLSQDLISQSLELVEKYRSLVVADSIFQQIGGQQGVKKLVDFHFDRVLLDPELRLFFLTSDVENVKRNLAAWLAKAFGGPGEYQGRDLKEAHRNMELTDRHFFLMKRHLAWAFHRIGAPSSIIDKALDIIENDRVNVLSAKSTFEELGEDIGLRQIVESMLRKAMKNPMLAPFFGDDNFERVADGFYKFMAKELGDPALARSTQVDLKMIHMKLNLSDFHLDALQNCIEAALREKFTHPMVIRDVLWTLERYRRKVCTISIYDLVGGDPFINNAASILSRKVKFHYRLAKFFQKLSDEELTQLMKHLVTYSVGGRRAYRGRDMKNAHETLGIKNEHFNDMKHLLRETFKELGVVDSLILQVLRIYEDKKRYVVAETPKKDSFWLGEESLID